MTDRDRDDTEGGAPKPGHFLPGGAGESTPETQRRKPAQPSLGQPRDLAPPSAHPAQSGTPGWQTARQPQHPQQVPAGTSRRRGPLIAGLIALALVLVAGIVFASSKIIDSFDSLGGQPISGSSERPTFPDDPSPTVTKTAPPPPTDAQVVKQNKLYAAGRPAASCKEPAARPDSRTGVGNYLQGVLTCLDKAWAPVVRKSGHEFRSPKLVLYAAGGDTCSRDAGKNSSVYCGGEETVNFPWDFYADQYERDAGFARLQLLDQAGVIYAFHLQELTGISDAVAGLRDDAPNDAARNEISRRSHLQADCLGAAFAGAVRGSFPLRGRTLKDWNRLMDGTSSDDPKTDGSRHSGSVWRRQGFAAAGPAACNTWTAPAKKVS